MKNACAQVIIITALAVLAPAILVAQQYPIPKTAAEVPGPPPGTKMTTAYVQAVGRMAYLWGWPLINFANRNKATTEMPEPGLIGGVLPMGHNAIAMLTNYIKADQRYVTCINQDVSSD
jgi:hypothetical protein